MPADMIPNLFLIGAPKCGTTMLVESLRQHPEIFVPQCKEPRYFDAPVFFDFPEDYPLKSLEDYLRLFSNANQQKNRWILDGSVFNMYSTTSIKEILRLSPNAKFMVCLREPLAAVKSMHGHRLKVAEPSMREISTDLAKCWRAIPERRLGKKYPDRCRNKFLFRYDELFSYEKYLPPIIDLIGQDNILILNYSRLSEDPEALSIEISNFLKLSSVVHLTRERVNSAYTVSANWLAKLSLRLGRQSSKLRKVIGLSGTRVRTIRRVLTGEKAFGTSQETSVDDEIKEYFKDTYQWLSGINSSSHNSSNFIH